MLPPIAAAAAYFKLPAECEKNHDQNFVLKQFGMAFNGYTSANNNYYPKEIMFQY